MEIFNIGPLELIIVLIIMFVLLGPKEMVLTAQRIGTWIRKIVRSPMWREIMGYSQEIRELPQKLMDDTGLKEAVSEIKQSTNMAATELNTTLTDAVKAARVPEAEHIRIDTSPVPASVKAEAAAEKPETKPAGDETRQTYPTPYQELEKQEAEPAQPEATILSTTLEVESPSPVDEGTPSNLNGKDTVENASAGMVDEPLIQEAPVEEKKPARKPRTPRSPKIVPVVTSDPADQSPADEPQESLPIIEETPVEPVLPEEAPPQKKPRKRKEPAQVVMAAQEETNNGAKPAEEQSSAALAEEPTAAPAKKPRRPRTAKIQESTPSTQIPSPEDGKSAEGL